MKNECPHAFLLFLYFFFGLMMAQLWAQAELPPRSALLIEVGGTSIGYSLSYQHNLWQGPRMRWSLRAGGGLLPQRLYLPMATEVAWGRVHHHAVLGLGATVEVQAERRWAFRAQNSDSYLRLNALVGYRWQSLRDRFFVQAHLVPGLELDPSSTQLTHVPPVGRWTAGVLLGYRFR